MRLSDGTDSSNGRVEICQYRTWHSVCLNNWKENNAQVICGQLDYNPAGKPSCFNLLVWCAHFNPKQMLDL